MKKFQWAVLALALFPMGSFAQYDHEEALEGTFEVREVTDSALPLNLMLSKPVMTNTRVASSSAGAGSRIGIATCAAPAAKSRVRVNRNLSRDLPIPVALQNTAALGSAASAIPELAAIDVALDQIINIGKKVWTVVAAGEPQVNLSSDVATALPATAPDQRLCWTELENWQPPQSRVYQVVFRNLYNIEVVRLEYRVLFIAGGSYQGVGRYIGYAAIQPTVNTTVSWGFNLKAEAKAPAVFNMGTKTNPVAGMSLEIQYTVKSGLKTATGSKVYFISGTGTFEELE